MDQNFRHEWAPCHFKQLVYFYVDRLSGLGLRPTGFDPTRRVQRSGLKKPRQLVYSEKFTNHGETAWPVDHTPME